MLTCHADGPGLILFSTQPVSQFLHNPVGSGSPSVWQSQWICLKSPHTQLVSQFLRYCILWGLVLSLFGRASGSTLDPPRWDAQLAHYNSFVGSVVECSLATQAARVWFSFLLNLFLNPFIILWDLVLSLLGRASGSAPDPPRWDAQLALSSHVFSCGSGSGSPVHICSCRFQFNIRENIVKLRYSTPVIDSNMLANLIK